MYDTVKNVTCGDGIFFLLETCGDVICFLLEG
jgi:hypothetical protein